MMHYSLPLFPLSTVIFPDGLLSLKVFETRYLDMVRACLRNNTPFGVVALYPESQLNLHLSSHLKPQFPFANIGTVFNIIDADVTCLGLINIRCRGQQKFKILSAEQAKDGLWIGEVIDVASEADIAIPDDLQTTQMHLQRIIHSLSEEDISELELPIAKPYKLQDCAWVANRWCEILNIPLIQKQRMLELDSPLVRLELIQDMLSKEFADD
jgi:Lon protease-like protein